MKVFSQLKIAVSKDERDNWESLVSDLVTLAGAKKAKIKDWILNYDRQGRTLYWTSKKTSIEVYATPFLENEPYVFMEIFDPDSAADMDQDIMSLKVTGDTDKDVKAYLSLMESKLTDLVNL